MVLLLFLFLLCLMFPEITHNGIKNGLILIVNQVIPALYPFILLTSVLKNNPQTSSKYLKIAIAFLSGYPLGAKIIAENSSKYSYLTSQEMLLLCTNPSPAFMISYVGYGCINDPIWGIMIYISVLIGNILNLTLKILIRHLKRKTKHPQGYIEACNVYLPDSNRIINESFFTILNLSTYILIFSVVAAFINKISSVNDLTKAICVGLVEMTTGIETISKLTIELEQKLLIITGMVSYGGLSIIAQTYSVIHGSDLSIKKYMTDKAISAIIAMSVMYYMIIIFNSY